MRVGEERGDRGRGRAGSDSFTNFCPFGQNSPTPAIFWSGVCCPFFFLSSLLLSSSPPPYIYIYTHNTDQKKKRIPHIEQRQGVGGVGGGEEEKRGEKTKTKEWLLYILLYVYSIYNPYIFFFGEKVHIRRFRNHGAK